MHDDLKVKVLDHIEIAIDQYLKGYHEKADRHFTLARAGADEISMDIDNLLDFIDYLIGRSDGMPEQP
jgi:hypothetical protein